MTTFNVTDETFKTEVLEAALPVVVDFWATWCAPCRMVAPALEVLSNEYAGSLAIAKVDVDACPRTASAYRIQSIPTLMLFRRGRPVQAVQGAQPQERLKALLESWLPELLGPSLTVDELAKRLSNKEPTALIDVRPEADYARSHLRGARRVDPDALEGELAGLAADTCAVLVCRTGDQSVRLAKTLTGRGYRASALREGLLAWEGRGHPTFSTREEEALAKEGA